MHMQLKRIYGLVLAAVSGVQTGINIRTNGHIDAMKIPGDGLFFQRFWFDLNGKFCQSHSTHIFQAYHPGSEISDIIPK